jgi:hypothetical protein
MCTEIRPPESDGMAKASQKGKRQILGVISPERAERMLMEWANTIGDRKSWERFFSLYPEVAVGTIANDVGLLRNQVMAVQMQRYLRKAWNAPDLRHFDWCAWSAQSFYFTECRLHQVSTEPATPQALSSPDLLFILEEDPSETITPVEGALFYFRHSRGGGLHSPMRCPNPECPAPYFFSSKKGQKFCTPECAKPSLRESKRQWWAVNRSKNKEE